MDIHFTARRFKAHPEIKQYAMDEVRKLGKIFDGIVRGEIILFYERGVHSLKTAEINLHVYGQTLTAHEKSDDYIKAIDGATEKLTTQLKKYKAKLRSRDKTRVRTIQSKV